VTDLDRALVRRKLARILRNLDDLAPIEALSLEAFRSERFRQKGTERLLQEVVEAAVDVNLHLLRVHGRPSPRDYYGSFTLLGDAGLIPNEVAEALAPSTGLRNRLVHEYDDLDDGIVLEAVAEARRLYPRYVSAIEELLDR